MTLPEPDAAGPSPLLAPRPPRVPVAGAAADGDELASLQQIAVVSGWLQLLSDRTHEQRAPGRKIDVE
ncbi:MAG TPA: hypothetical protein VGR28_14840 [Candidatus Thermoplasmatota archaeon]|jgi:hypothetical protein|nr:hypothetical protein [Candidatus Thermoplasmatota archaeon]